MNLTTLQTYTEKVLQGQDITFSEALELISLSAQDTSLLLAMADKIRQHYSSEEVDCCAIINGRSSRCPENCRFCAQSAHYHTGTTVYPLLDSEMIIAAAKKKQKLPEPFVLPLSPAAALLPKGRNLMQFFIR